MSTISSADFITSATYPDRYAEVVGSHRLVGWGDWSTMAEQVTARTFGHMVKAATPVVVEYHSDLFHDAFMLRNFLNAAFDGEAHKTGTVPAEFAFCVRHSGTNFGTFARHMFESWAYDAALYRFKVYAVGGEWRLDITLTDARPDRPTPVIQM